jgi:hypothetical protein
MTNTRSALPQLQLLWFTKSPFLHTHILVTTTAAALSLPCLVFRVS